MSMQFALGRLKAMGPSDSLRRFGKWWLQEFLGLFPQRIVEFLSGRGRILLAIAVDDRGATLELLNGVHASIASERPAQPRNLLTEIDQFLRSLGYDRADTDIGLRLTEESIFTRQFLLPAEAIDAIDAIVVQDLAKKTPFKPEDVYSDHGAPERVDGNKIRVWQWIIRRQYVNEALSPLGIGIESLAFIVAGKSAEGQPVPFINLRSGRNPRDPWYRKAALALCASAIALGLVAGGVKYWNQRSAMDRLDERIAAVSSKAQQIRVLADQTQEKKNALLRLRLQRSERPGLIDVWEEMTRVLPSQSWLTEFRVGEVGGSREDQIVISGFSSAAPSLVGIIDSSPLFFDAALTSPIAFDATEGRERFTLQARVKVPASLKEATR